MLEKLRLEGGVGRQLVKDSMDLTKLMKDEGRVGHGEHGGAVGGGGCGEVG